MSGAWQPTASCNNLRLRAQMLARIRQFFAARAVLEVETPLLSQHTVTDLHIDSFATTYAKGNITQHYFLQTSPEYAMKRLLAAGSGPIFQISKAFRNNESGRQHNPEFTLLEWYRPGFDHHALMDEVDELLHHLLDTQPAARISYRQLFINYLDIDPWTCDATLLQAYARTHDITLTSNINDTDTLLQLLLSHVIEPKLGRTAPTFIYNFPVTQAALATIKQGDFPHAQRFELYLQGLECANGFHELTAAQEQLTRLQCEQSQRTALGHPVPTIDQRFIAALQHGLPPCAGVAVGLDRLLMIMAQAEQIADVIAFPWERA